MSTAQSPRYAVGTQVRLSPRPMTRERMRWYVDIQETVQVDDGRIHVQPPTIHDDDAYAHKQGLPGIISDGMITTNWIHGLLVDMFGPAAAGTGWLRTKYIRPIYEDQIVIAAAKVIGVLDNERRETVYTLEVWCEDDQGQMLTVGDACVHQAQP
jgi:3-hydroxybutyryl-CoA dehydratase